jgi:hypothetical protein
LLCGQGVLGIAELNDFNGATMSAPATGNLVDDARKGLGIFDLEVTSDAVVVKGLNSCRGNHVKAG